MPPATVRVWDPFVRVFHWSLVTLFMVAFVTGDEATGAHRRRIRHRWPDRAARRLGFRRSPSRPFSHFVRPPREVLAYLRDVALLRAPRHVGHNPAGGAMIVALLVMLAATSLTGYMMTTDAFWGAKWMEEVHETWPT